MRRLDFDFARQRRSPGWAGWLLLALGLAFVVDLARDYASLEADVRRLEARLPYVDEPAGKPVSQGRAPSADEFAAARAVVARFAAPWRTLFAAIESVQLDDVSLLSIEPEPATGQVLITGEAKDYLALLTYVAQLGAQPGLAGVYLSRHEIRDAPPRRPIAFSVLAQWRRP